MNSIGAGRRLIILHPDDDVAICQSQMMSGAVTDGVLIKGLIPAGHKVALRSIALGEAVRRYNQIIGFAAKDIQIGEHVHMHNLIMGDFDRDYAFGVDAKPASNTLHAEFLGIKRANGRVATRNYIGILSSVNCSSTVARSIANHFALRNPGGVLQDFPNIDGVVALTHGAGCGMGAEGLGMRVLQRTLSGY